MTASLKEKLAANRQGILLAVAVLLGLAVGLRAGVSWYVEYDRELDNSIEMKTAQYEKAVRVAGRGQQYEAVNKRLKKLMADLERGGVVTAQTPALAEAKFQNIVKDLAAKSGLTIRALKILPRSTGEGLSLLNMSINARAEIGSIEDFMVAVESSGRFLFLTEAEIKRINRREKRFFYFNAKLSALTRI